MYKTPRQQLQTSCFAMEVISQMFCHFRRRWDSTASIINAFTTFLLLTSSKILFVSFTLLYTFPRQDCFVLWPKSWPSYLGVCHVCIYSCVCVTSIHINFLLQYPTRLFRKCVLLLISGVAYFCTFVESLQRCTRMEAPMVLVSSEWFLHLSSF